MTINPMTKFVKSNKRGPNCLAVTKKADAIQDFFFFFIIIILNYFWCVYKTLCDLTARMLALLLDFVVCLDGCDRFDVHP